jgi:hypothetical protein
MAARTVETYKNILRLLHSRVGINGTSFSKLAQIVRCELSFRETTVKHALRYGMMESIVKRTGFGKYSFTYPIHQAHANQIASRTSKKKRVLSKERLTKLRTLENPLFYHPLVKKLKSLNADGRFDPQMLDTTLEPGEALADLKKNHPEITVYNEGEELDPEAEFRHYLEEKGIENKKVQDLVIAQMEGDEPFSEAEILAFASGLESIREKQVTNEKVGIATPQGSLTKH